MTDEYFGSTTQNSSELVKRAYSLYTPVFQSSQEGLTALDPLSVFIQSATTLLPLSKNTKHKTHSLYWP